MQPQANATELDSESVDQLAGVIAAQLSVTRPPAQRAAAIASGLLQRARRSARSHREFVTLRREDRVYTTVSAGVRSHTLRHGKGVRIDLLHLEPGASLNWPDGVVAQEVLVIEGALNEGLNDAMAVHSLFLRRELSQSLVAGSAGARLYVRQLTAPEELPEIEKNWWDATEPAQASPWEILSEGVEIKVLRGVGGVMSTLARIAPGAQVVDHGHMLDEECLMLQGDLFLGDILLRPDDYQVAPAGCNHVNSMSDTGALFYFHGHMPTPV
jgi:hypothetical protein